MTTMHEIHQDDFGSWRVGLGDEWGPFESREFAQKIADGTKPASIKNDPGGKFRRFRIVREVSSNAP